MTLTFCNRRYSLRIIQQVSADGISIVSLADHGEISTMPRALVLRVGSILVPLFLSVDLDHTALRRARDRVQIWRDAYEVAAFSSFEGSLIAWPEIAGVDTTCAGADENGRCKSRWFVPSLFLQERPLVGGKAQDCLSRLLGRNATSRSSKSEIMWIGSRRPVQRKERDSVQTASTALRRQPPHEDRCPAGAPISAPTRTRLTTFLFSRLFVAACPPYRTGPTLA
jgi:hypothetical protein